MKHPLQSDENPGERVSSFRKGRFGVALAAFVVALTGAATPGPLLALVIAQVLTSGVPAVLFILAGHALLELVFVILFAAGFSRFVRGAAVRSGLALIGGSVLMWMGFLVFRDIPSMKLAAADGNALSWAALIAAGAGVSIANPYFTGWWATVGAGQAAALRLNAPQDFYVFWLGHEAGDAAWYLLVAVALTLGRALLSDEIYRGILYLCATVMLGMGLAFVVVGLRALRGERKSLRAAS